MSPVRQASFLLEYDNKDITAALSPIVNSITYTDKLDGESDELEVEIDNGNGRWRGAWYPEKGAGLNLRIGWAGDALLPCGQFTLDEAEFRSPPDVVVLKALAAGIGGDSRTKRSVAYETGTLADIAGKVAARHGYTVVGLASGGLKHERLTQNGEVDLAFLARLARTWGYVFTVKGKQLVFQAVEELDRRPAVLVVPFGVMKNSSLRDKSDQVYRACTVSYRDPGTGTQVEHTATAPGAKPEGDTLQLNERAESKAHAEAICQAALRRSQGRRTEGTITLDGDPRLVAGNNLEVVDMERLNGVYQVKEARHTLTRGGGWDVSLEVSRVG